MSPDPRTSGLNTALDPLERALLEYSSEFVVFVDTDGEVVLGAGEGLRILGYSPEPQRGEHIIGFIHPDDVPEVTEVIARAQRTPGLDESVRVRALRKEGGWVVLDVHVGAVVDHPVLGSGAILRARDLGSVDISSPALAHDERFDSLTHAILTGVLTVEASGRVIDANPAAAQLLHRPVADLLERGWIDCVVPDDRDDLAEALELLTRGAPQAEAVVRVEVDGGIRWMHATVVALGQDPAPGWLVALDDVTELHRTGAELSHRATHDPLTDLPNRVLLDDRLAQACARLGADGHRVTVLFGDLDRFKPVNDHHGHRVGDEVLCAVGARLQRVVRSSDTVVRLGGDEFVVVCEDLDDARVEALQQRITDVVAEPIVVDGEEFRVAITFGVASASEEVVHPAELVARADLAMYQVKARGGS